MRSLYEIEALSRRALQRTVNNEGTPLPVEPQDARDLGILIQHLGHIPFLNSHHGWLELDARTEGYATTCIEVNLEELTGLTKLAYVVQKLVARYGCIGLGMLKGSRTCCAHVYVFLPSPNHHN